MCSISIWFVNILLCVNCVLIFFSKICVESTTFQLCNDINDFPVYTLLQCHDTPITESVCMTKQTKQIQVIQKRAVLTNIDW